MSDNTEKVTGIGGIFFKVRDGARMSPVMKMSPVNTFDEPKLCVG